MSKKVKKNVKVDNIEADKEKKQSDYQVNYVKDVPDTYQVVYTK